MSLSDAEIDALRHSRSSFGGVATRSIRRNEELLTEDPATYDLKALADRLTSLEGTEKRCLAAQETILNEETDQAKLIKDEEAGDVFENSIRAVKSLVQRLIDMKESHGLASEIKISLDNLDDSQRNDPSKDYSATVDDLRID